MSNQPTKTAKGKEIKVFLPWNSAMGGGDMYKLVPFYYGFDEQGERVFAGYLLKPVIDEKPNYKKMTKAELIELLEENPTNGN